MSTVADTLMQLVLLRSSPHSRGVHSLAAKPAADATFGLTCLLLDGLVEFVNLLVQLFGGIFPKLLGFALSIGQL
jgi:hypothetical protein